ncbi:hypothetical protein Bca4012_018084 [Brassica carinata]
MDKTYIETCLLSGQQLLFGAGFGSKLLKHKWYAVGWIDPEDKYCTTIDGSRSDNPLWGTKFITSLDVDDVSKIQAALHVEVYSLAPIFLTKKLHGSATVPLKEILAKYKKNQSSSSSVVEETRSCSSSVFEETISCQLRKQNSSKPRGFVYVSIRISAERQDFEDKTGLIFLSTNSGNNSSRQNYMDGSSQHPFATSSYQPNSSNSFSFPPDNHHFPMPDPLTNNTFVQTQHPYYPPLPPMQQPYYPPPPMQQPNYPPAPVQQPCYPSAPPLPPATSNAGYMPSNMPRSDNAVNIPPLSSSSSSSGGYARPGSAGLGAGAIAGDPAFHGRDVYLT